MLTVVTWVRPPISRNVLGMAITAISSGSRASRLPKTKASTASAPRPPSKVSASVPVPSREESPAASWFWPVTPACHPGGAAARAAAR